MSAMAPPAFSPWRAYALEARYEFLRLLRTPSFVLPVLSFPALFYLLFGILLNRSGNGDAARYLLATYGVFGVMGVGLFGFGVSVAMERERGLLTFKRALPMPRGAYLLAKMAMAAIFAALISILLSLLAVTLGGVSLQPWQWLVLLVVDVIGVLPFCAVGLFIGTHVGGQGSPAVVNLVYLPMSFLSGLWLPLAMLPAWLSAAASVWPSYHLAQVALKVVGMDAGGAIGGHVAVLAAVSALFLALAWRRLARA
ncbi:ABC transporter permease [Pseudoxanthomonas sp. UTMC 1351]|uniref:ABC transporter permease n=1 Tax=Pseudoxanthomonas sp. UTMC 1351 TaxID=2695853 RepID=UPI0034CEDCFC